MFEGVPPIEIIPAVLVKRWDDLRQALEQVRSVAHKVQIDVVDGKFVHGKTWPYTDPDQFEEITREEAGMPFWEEIDFEFDLMLQYPDDELHKYVRAGASRIVLHLGSENIGEAFHRLISAREDEGGQGIAVGIAILPTTPIEALEPFEGQFDFVQVMGIEHVGKQGEPFDIHAQYLVERLHRRYPGLPLQVDGGVQLANARALVRAGAHRLIVGSAIFKSDDPAAAYNALVAEVNKPN